MDRVKETIWDVLWWHVGLWLWKKSARQHPQSEVKRRLSWMSLDYNFEYEWEKERRSAV